MRSEAGQLHLLRTDRLIPRAFELAFGAELDPVVQACFGDAQHFGRDRCRLSAFDQPDRLHLEFQRVLGPFSRFTHFVLLELIFNHQLSSTFFGGKVNDTLLNTDLVRERKQLGRFMQMVVEHKHSTGFKGQLLIEPKPHEPTKHQYDRDVATFHGFLKEFGLDAEIKLNVEANHATLAGHSFHHEVASAIALGIFGSVDANRGDPQNGWDTDQFPNSVEELSLVLYEILKSGGLGQGGFNFDAKVRRQSMGMEDLFYGHIGAMDTLALALEKAVRLIEKDFLSEFRDIRYANWNSELGQSILNGGHSLVTLAGLATDKGLDPQPVSGRQEMLEARINQALFG